MVFGSPPLVVPDEVGKAINATHYLKNMASDNAICLPIGLALAVTYEKGNGVTCSPPLEGLGEVGKVLIQLKRY